VADGHVDDGRPTLSGNRDRVGAALNSQSGFAYGFPDRRGDHKLRESLGVAHCGSLVSTRAATEPTPLYDLTTPRAGGGSGRGSKR